MALIKCPECGQTISDKATKCPRCGFPLTKDSTQAAPSDSTTVQTENATDAEHNVQTDLKIFPKKRRFPFIIILICFILVCICLLGYSISTQTLQPLHVNELSFDKWVVTERSSYSITYEGTLLSDEKSPFIAVIGEYQESASDIFVPSLVYMNDGAGVFPSYIYTGGDEENADDPSATYRPIGILNGRTVSESDLKVVSCRDTTYSDYEYSDLTSCTIDIELELNQNVTGILFFDLENDMTNNVTANDYCVVVDGKSSFSRVISDLPYRSRGVNAVLIPKFFCPSQPIGENDYTVSSPFSAKKSDTFNSYTGTMVISIPEHSDGYILYTQTLISGGQTDNQGIPSNEIAYLHNSQCEFETYDFESDQDTIIVTPEYNFILNGYIAWTPFE